MTGLYEGLRVLDFTHGFAGPYCSRVLADMGAEIIKVEPSEGDLARNFPFVIAPGDSGFFLQVNAGKRGIVLDLKRPEGVEIARRLAAISDVVLENFKPGVMDRLGISYERLREGNAGLIMVSISCYGQTGPYARRPGAEMAAQAYGGVMDLTGEPDGPPTLVGVGIADVNAGTHALAAIGAALYCRARTGLGQHVDVALLDCILEAHITPFQEYLLSGRQIKQTRTGAHHSSLAPFGTFKGKDGYLTLAAVDNARWGRLCQAMDRADLVDDPRFSTPDRRLANRRELNQIIADWVAGCESIQEPLDRMNALEVPCAPVLGIEQIVDDPHIQARQMFVTVDHPIVGPVPVLNTPLKFSATPTRIGGRAPGLGEHTEAILRDLLGLSRQAIEALASEGVTRARQRAR